MIVKKLVKNKGGVNSTTEEATKLNTMAKILKTA
jgi:hypothetical protein